MTAALTKTRASRRALHATAASIAALGLFFSAACSSDGGSGETVTVTVKDMVYEPAVVTISPGDTVTWVWESDLPHDVVGDDGDFQSELINEGEFSYTFEKVGVYSYHCTPHPAMVGEVIVEE